MKEENRFSVGNSHVLGPKLRTPKLASGVLIRLLHKAAARLRYINYFARSISVGIDCVDGEACHHGLRMAPCHDTLRLIEFVAALWPREFPSPPKRVSVVLADLIPAHNVARLLFEEDRQLSALAKTMDQVNQRFGAHAVYFAGMHGQQDTAHTAIAFNQIPDLNLADA